MLTVLPVQLISAGVQNSGMKMNMQKFVQLEQKCMHASTEDSQQSTGFESSCCEDASHQCDNCTNCPQAASASFTLPVNYLEDTPSLSSQKIINSHLLVSGLSQKNLLRPPRIII